VQWKITEADTQTIQLGTTPSGLISNPPPSSPIFMPAALPAATLSLYPGLGQAPNILACIPLGVVHYRLLRIKIQVKKMRLMMMFKNSSVCSMSNVRW